MLIEFEVHFECNAVLFSLTLRVITPVWRDETDAIHSVSIVLVFFVSAIFTSTYKTDFLSVQHRKIS